MSTFTMTRRSFAKLAAATAVATAMSAASAPLAALAEAEVDAEQAGEVKRIRSCCRGCGKMECGVWVTVKDGRAIKIEGDESAFHSQGNCCTKSQSSMHAAYHPDRMYYPMKRTNPRGDSDPGWVRITWDEAFETIVEKLQECIDKYGGETVFGMSGTSRIWGMIAYGALPQLVGSGNMAIPWQVCKGPRFFAGAMQSMMQSSWMETVGHPLVYTSWGTGPEMSNYDDSCRTIVDVAERAEQHIIVDPRMTNGGKEADQWLNVRPGTDGAMIMGWLNYIIENDLYDDLFAKKWTNGPFLVCDDIEPSGHKDYTFYIGRYDVKTRLLKESDMVEDGSPYRYMVWDNLNDRLTWFDADTGMWEGQAEIYETPTAGHEGMQENLVPGVSQGFVLDPTPFNPEIDPALYGEFEVTLKDGTVSTVKPVWEYFAAKCAEYPLDKVAEITGVPADKIELAVKTHATRMDPSTGYGNGGVHYQLAIEHSCNAINFCRAMDTYVGLTGNWDVPGGHRGATMGLFTLKAGLGSVSYGSPYPDPEIYNRACGTEDFPVLKWWQGWADDASLFKAMETGEPYPLKFGWCSTGDIMNMSNPNQKWAALYNVDFFVFEDLFKAPTSGMADILLPVHHWLETDCPRQSQGAAGAVGATVRCIEPPADTMHDIDIITHMYELMGKPWGYEDNPYPSRIENLDLMLQFGNMTGQFLTWDEFNANFQENGWMDAKVLNPAGWGTYRRYETGFLPLKLACGGNEKDQMKELTTPGFGTPTRKMEIWSTIIETFQPEADLIPDYHEPPLSPVADPEMCEKYPFIATSGRRIPVYFHSEHRQLPWCRELWPAPRIEINPEDAAELGIEHGDWVWIENDNTKIRQKADLYYGVNKGVVNLEHQWWFPELEQADHGFPLSNCNCLVTTGVGYQDPICGASYLRAYPVKIYKATPENSPFGNPVPCGEDGTEIIHLSDDERLKAWMPTYEGRE